MNKIILGVIVLIVLVGGSWILLNKNDSEKPLVEADQNFYEDGTPVTFCDAEGNRYETKADALAVGLSEAEFGATYCPEYLQPRQ